MRSAAETATLVNWLQASSPVPLLIGVDAEAGLGLQPSFLVGQLFQACYPLAAVALLVYNGLPLAFIALLSVQLQANRRPVRILTPRPSSRFALRHLSKLCGRAAAGVSTE